MRSIILVLFLGVAAVCAKQTYDHAVHGMVRNVFPKMHKTNEMHAETWGKVKEFFKKIGLEIKEHFTNFGEWAKNVLGEQLQNLKDKVAQHKLIAREIIDHVKDVSKDVAREALEYLRPYKEDLGLLWDQLQEKVREILNRKEYPINRHRAASENWEKIKEFFKKIGLHIQEHFQKFGEWVKNVVGEKLQIIKDKVAQHKIIAREIIDHVKDVSKDVAREALEYLRLYKEDLGLLWDQLQEKVREILNRKE